MTRASQPPDDEFPRDAAFDEAWRALSGEEPPAAIDAALRAAARREAGAGPLAAVAHGDAGARAPKAMNWWRPLAVAATLGALAIGLLQLVTPEHLGAPSDGGVVSDMPAGGGARQELAKKQAAAAASNEIAAPAEQARTLPAPAAPDASADRKEAQPQFRDSVASTSQPAPYDELAQRNLRKDVSPERKRDAAQTAVPAAAAPAMPAPKLIEAPASAPVANTAPMRAAEPFPAEGGKREAESAKREPAADAVSSRASAAPAAAGVVAPTTLDATNDKALAPKPVTEDRAAALAKLKTAPAPVAGERGAPTADFAQARREQDAQAPLQGKPAMQAATPMSNIDARVAEHARLSVPDWIALIRRLIAERKFADADKELAAFRAAHLDADRVLPPDLRDWKAPR